MEETYESSWWSIELPTDWCAEQDESCVSFTAGKGAGALQISAYKHEGAIVSSDDMRDFAKDELRNDSITENVLYGDFKGIEISYFEADSFWRKLWLRSGAVLLYVTYNCASEKYGVEGETVTRILSSLQSRIGTV